jgi:probable poly-beta-1,6-N-acetyl-D-glucosamine export protein
MQRARSSPRLANVERLRLVAMFEIVAFHASEHRLPIVAGLGLPVFLLLNNAFNCTLTERMGTRPFLHTKVSRLLLPWLLWSVIYLVVVVLGRLRHEELLTVGFSLWMLVGGTYPHLWFVPFALAGALLMAVVQPATRALPHGVVIAAALLTGAALTLLNARILAPGTIEWPVLQWLFALPALPLGFALGRTMLAADRVSRLRVAWVCVAVALLCLGLGLGFGLGLVGWGVPEMVRRYAVSMALVGLAFVWPGAPDPVSQRLTPLLLGVYLVHPLIVRVYQALHLPVPPTAVFAALVFGVSALLVSALQRSRLRLLV